MKLTVKTALDEAFLEKIIALDKSVYPGEMAGDLMHMKVRFRQNRDTFVCLMDGEKLAGYINLLPLSEGIWEKILTQHEYHDDDIGTAVTKEGQIVPCPDRQIEEYREGRSYRLFILSVVLDTPYRGNKEAAAALSDAFIQYIQDKEERGCRIEAIAAIAVSSDGQRFLRNHLFRIVYDFGKEAHTDEEYAVMPALLTHPCICLCDGDYLDKLKAGEIYYKTWKDDVYLLLPFAEHPRNPKNVNIERDSEAALEGGEELPQQLMDELQNYIDYECSNEVTAELRQYYLGRFRFLHTYDEYDRYMESEEEACVVGEEDAYLLLMGHPRTHMYVLTLVIPDCGFSTSQVFDQCSNRYLRIREETKEAGTRQYTPLETWLREKYGLLSCGAGKALTCMSGRPHPVRVGTGRQGDEFLNILTGEVYNSMRQNFHIMDDDLIRAASENLAVYDYYEAYMTDKVIAFILTDYENIDITERISLTASYIFIMELITLQNTAVNKMLIKTTRALSSEGDVDYGYVEELYREYAMTVRFWETENFHYFGTQREAMKIRKAFGNDALLEDFARQQELLEHIVDLKNGRHQQSFDNIIGAVALFLAVLQVRDILVDLLRRFYGFFGIEVADEAVQAAQSMGANDLVNTVNEMANADFNTITFGGAILILCLWLLLRRKSHYDSRRKK